MTAHKNILLLGTLLTLSVSTCCFAQDSTSNWYQYVVLNGLIMGSTTYNFNHPSNDKNELRSFDVDANSLNLDLFSLSLHHDPHKGEAGFRADVDVGPYIPEIIHSAGLQMGDFDLPQAYFSYLSKLGNGLQIDAGKFFSTLGFEQVERFDGINYNASHSFLFSYALPFTDTGLRLTYPFDSAFSVMGIVTNGWGNSFDNNNAKSGVVQLRWEKNDVANLALGAIIGPEKANNISDNRMLIDLNSSIIVIVLSHVFPISLGLELVYAREENDFLSADSTSGSPMYGTASWVGNSIYAHFGPPKFSTTVRIEFLDDMQGARTGTAQNLMENTATLEWKPTENLFLRGEWRSDQSSEPVFNHFGTNVTTQNTASLNAIYLF